MGDTWCAWCFFVLQRSPQRFMSCTNINEYYPHPLLSTCTLSPLQHPSSSSASRVSLHRSIEMSPTHESVHITLLSIRSISFTSMSPHSSSFPRVPHFNLTPSPSVHRLPRARRYHHFIFLHTLFFHSPLLTLKARLPYPQSRVASRSPLDLLQAATSPLRHCVPVFSSA